MGSLENIAEDIRKCTRCELRTSCTQPVPGYGEVEAKYFIIGEAPGKDEDEEGMPFVGAAGRKLDKLLPLAGIDINDCYISNICRCRPPKNRTPKKKEVQLCTEFLYREIRLVKPKYIITLGSTPLSIFTSNGVSQVHGTQMKVEVEGKDYILIAQYHPAAELHNPRLRATILEDWEHMPEVVPHDFIVKETTKLNLSGMPLAAMDTEQDGKGGLGQWSVAYRDGSGQLAVAPFCGKNRDIEWGNCPVVFHNAKYDIRVLQENKMPVPEVFHDTMIAAYCLGLGKAAPKDNAKSKSGSDMVGGLGLKYLARRHLGMEMLKWNDVKDRPELVPEYNAADSIATYLLFEKWKDELPKHYFDIDIKLLPVIMAMEDRGIMIDEGYLTEYAKELDASLNEIDLPLNPNANQEIQSYVYGTLGIEPWKFTETGQPSVDEEVLDQIDDPVVNNIQKFKSLSKDKTTYVENYIRGKDINDRIHPEFKQTSTSTGRLSAANPNLQNVPDPKKGSSMRKLFIAKPGYKLVRMDWERMELWGFAAIAKEERMLKTLMDGGDPHQETADFLGVPRHEGRNINFLMVYGGGAWKISHDFGVPIDRAKEIIAKMYKEYPGIKGYHEQQIALANSEKKISLPISGRTRRIDAMYATDWRVRKEGEREAINMPVQGGTAEICKLAMIDLHYRHNVRLLLQVHDELVSEIKAKEAKEFAEWLKVYVPKITPWDGIELPVDVSVGSTWYECCLE